MLQDEILKTIFLLTSIDKEKHLISDVERRVNEFLQDESFEYSLYELRADKFVETRATAKNSGFVWLTSDGLRVAKDLVANSSSPPIAQTSESDNDPEYGQEILSPLDLIRTDEELLKMIERREDVEIISGSLQEKKFVNLWGEHTVGKTRTVQYMVDQNYDSSIYFDLTTIESGWTFEDVITELEAVCSLELHGDNTNPPAKSISDFFASWNQLVENLEESIVVIFDEVDHLLTLADNLVNQIVVLLTKWQTLYPDQHFLVILGNHSFESLSTVLSRFLTKAKGLRLSYYPENLGPKLFTLFGTHYNFGLEVSEYLARLTDGYPNAVWKVAEMIIDESFRENPFWTFNRTEIDRAILQELILLLRTCDHRLSEIEKEIVECIGTTIDPFESEPLISRAQIQQYLQERFSHVEINKGIERLSSKEWLKEENGDLKATFGLLYLWYRKGKTYLN